MNATYNFWKNAPTLSSITQSTQLTKASKNSTVKESSNKVQTKNVCTKSKRNIRKTTKSVSNTCGWKSSIEANKIDSLNNGWNSYRVSNNTTSKSVSNSSGWIGSTVST